MSTLPPTRPSVAEEVAAISDRETHLAHRGVELAADAFASILSDYFARRLTVDLLHAAAQATAPVEGK